MARVPRIRAPPIPKTTLALLSATLIAPLPSDEVLLDPELPEPEPEAEPEPEPEPLVPVLEAPEPEAEDVGATEASFWIEVQEPEVSPPVL